MPFGLAFLVGDCNFQSYLASSLLPIAQVERLLTDTGVFIIISYGNPEQRLPFMEQHDIDVPRYTPWTIEVQALCKWQRVHLKYVSHVTTI
jgi:hypothetical protein